MCGWPSCGGQGCCVYNVWGGRHVWMALMWRPGDEFVQFILSSHLYIGSRDQIQVIKLGDKCLWSLNYPTGCIPWPVSP